ncbi:MAG TPA: hypothetical protein VK912_17425 [Longimicrobiales bacterium]|nr:hypothetical protein [Longimicrobiales bacterium]
MDRRRLNPLGLLDQLRPVLMMIRPDPVLIPSSFAALNLMAVRGKPGVEHTENCHQTHGRQ